MKKTFLCLLITLLTVLSCFSCASPIVVPGEEGASVFDPDAELLYFYVINTHGASDAMLIVYGDQTMMVDCGDTGQGRAYVKPLLDELGIDHIDYAFNTHPHDDHINGFLTLFDEVRIDRFYTCFPMSYSDEQTAAMKAAMKHGIEIEFVDNMSDISFGDLQIWLYQDPSYVTAQPASANNASMIMHITYGESTLMITGDADKAVLADLCALKGNAMQSDIIKMPHHGYNRPSYEVYPFINPGYAVITNSLSDKIIETENFLNGLGCPTIYTGWGTVVCITDGKVWTVSQ